MIGKIIISVNKISQKPHEKQKTPVSSQYKPVHSYKTLSKHKTKSLDQQKSELTRQKVQISPVKSRKTEKNTNNYKGL